MKLPDITVLTAADVNYAPRLCANFAQWMKMPGLAEQRFTVLCVDVSHDHPAFDPIRAHVKLIRYDRPEGVTLAREAALSAFVFGAARFVDTPYLFKLDGDVRPVAPEFVWPDYHAATITASACGYTKSKPVSERVHGHFLNRLDAWWGGEPVFPANIPAGTNYRHKRLKSYAWIEKTDFTRRLAARCGSRLPVPSQDTVGCYCAMRWNEPMQRYGFGSYFKP